MTALLERSEILFLYQVRDCNPNGDPLEDNQPRMDPEAVRAAVVRELDALEGSCEIGTSFRRMAQLAGACHDLGKATPYFQAYLDRGRRSDLTPHAHLSAIVVFHLGRRLLEADGLVDSVEATGHLVFATLAVRSR